jgi:hypothetical protein
MVVSTDFAVGLHFTLNKLLEYLKPTTSAYSPSRAWNGVTARGLVAVPTRQQFGAAL